MSETKETKFTATASTLCGPTICTADLMAAQHAQQDRERAAAEQAHDAERWRFARKQMLWADAGDGRIKWVVFIEMPIPGVNDAGADALDAGVDAALNASRLSHEA